MWIQAEVSFILDEHGLGKHVTTRDLDDVSTDWLLIEICRGLKLEIELTFTYSRIVIDTFMNQFFILSTQNFELKNFFLSLIQNFIYDELKIDA